MATNSEAHSSTYLESSSDDECLSAVKRKAEIEDAERQSRFGEDTDDEPIGMAGVLVTVEVEEMDEDCPLEFNKVGKQSRLFEY